MHILQRCAGMRPLLLSLAALALCAPGCSEPFTAYRLHGDQSYVAQDRKILVMPFMDTRTFIDKDDTHRADMGAHARNIFVAAMRAYNADAVADIAVPAMPQPVKSLTNAEVADIGREYGADYVVAGQVFSYTGTRAASIPPRAGMFVRVISAHDGSLLFVGDHYQAAAIPGAPGGRELQARNVSSRLIEGFLAKAQSSVMATANIAAAGALAMIAPVPVSPNPAPADTVRRDRAAGDEPAPQPRPVLPGLAGGNLFNSDEWDEQIVPEVPPLVDFPEDFYRLSAPELPDPLPILADGGADGESGSASPVAKDASPVTKAVPDQDPVAAALADIQERREDAAAAPELYPDVTAAPETPGQTPAPEQRIAAAEPVTKTEPASPEVRTVVTGQIEGRTEGTAQFYREPAHYADAYVDAAAAAVIEELPELDIRRINPNMISVDAPPPAPVAAGMTGDELGADLFSDLEEALLRIERDGQTGRARPETEGDAVSGAARPEKAARGAAGESTARSRPATRRLPVPAPSTPAAAAADNGPIVSVPLAVEQPSTVKTVNQELAEDPDAARMEAAARVEAPPPGNPGGIRVLILPYHDRPNSHNLIPNTGGGEVVTTLFGTQLALDSGITLLWDGSGQATHDRLEGKDEAIMMGRLAGADYVIRGQVVEFRRAQSVPSFYSAMISTAVLAAQIFFAEMSGVDVATEVYRVSDGMCVMSRRDRSQQKYVVQAEKTVRRMAAEMADSVGFVVRQTRPMPMDPLIDELSPVAALAAAQ